MEDDAVVESLARQFLDPGHVVRRQIREQLDDDPTVLELQMKGVFGIQPSARPGIRRAALHAQIIVQPSVQQSVSRLFVFVDIRTGP